MKAFDFQERKKVIFDGFCFSLMLKIVYLQQFLNSNNLIHILVCIDFHHSAVIQGEDIIFRKELITAIHIDHPLIRNRIKLTLSRRKHVIELIFFFYKSRLKYLDLLYSACFSIVSLTMIYNLHTCSREKM